MRFNETKNNVWNQVLSERKEDKFFFWLKGGLKLPIFKPQIN